MQSPSSGPMSDPEPTPGQPTAAPPTAPPTAPPGPDPLARQLVGGLLSCLLLLLPLRAALGVRSDAGVLLWIVVGVAVVLAFGLALRWSRVPRGLSVAAATAGCFLLAAVVAMPVLAWIGDPGHDTAIALMVGLASAAVATPVGVAVVDRAGDAATGAAVAVCVGGMGLAAALGPAAGAAVFDARDDAELVAELEDAGVEGYLPEIGDLEVEYAGGLSSAESGRATGYTLSYEPTDADGYDRASVKVQVSTTEVPPCEDTGDYLTCREGSGYVVVERDGATDEVVAGRGSMTLTAKFYDGSGTVPDADEVGAALADAEEVDLEDIAGLQD